MAWVFLLGLITIPVVEIALFVKAIQWLGLLPTLLLAVGAGALGLILVRGQGLRAVLAAHGQIRQGTLPLAPLFDGLCVSVAGLLLILPGFLSDVLALALLLPPVRALLLVWLARRVSVVSPRPHDPTIIDGDFTVVSQPERRIEPHENSST